MANKFQIKRTSFAGRTPNTTNSGNSAFIDTGELALNLTDGKMFSSNGSVAFEIGANVSNLQVSGNVVLGSDLTGTVIVSVPIDSSLYPFDGGKDIGSSVNRWSNLYSNNISSTGTLTVNSISVNGSIGTAGQLLASNGSAAYWSSAAAVLGAVNYAQNAAPQISTSSTSPVVLAEIPLTVSGNPVQIFVSGDANPLTTGGWGRLQIYRDSTPLGAQVHFESSNANENVPYALQFIDNPGTGTFTYSLKSNYVTGNTQYGETSGPVISTVELQNAKGDANTDRQYTWTNNHIHTNSTRLAFSPLAGGSNVYFTLQNDDNFVFYNSNTTNGSRAVFSIYANNDSSSFQHHTPLQINANLILGTSAVSANGSTGTAGYALITNGTSTYWGSVGDSLTLGGSNTYIQFNNSGSLGGVAGLTFDSTSNTLYVANSISIGSGTAANQTYVSGLATAAYSNAVSHADTKAGDAYTNALSYAAVTYAPLAGAVFTGSVNATSFSTSSFTANSTGIIPVSNTHSLGDVSNRWNVYGSNGVFSGGVTIDGNLTVSGNTITISSQTLSVTDNMFYMNQGISANVTNAVGNGSAIIFTANNNFANGWDVFVSGVTPSSFNGTYHNITEANATHFIVANTNTDTYVSGGMARGKTDSNPDIGFAAGYNDGSYHHAGFFRDATDGYFKVFDNYAPEPDTSVFIDTSNTSFRIANFQANDIIGSTANIATSVSTANLVVTGNASVNNILSLVSISANGSLGSANQVLTSDGTTVYWANSGGGGAKTTMSNTAPTSPEAGNLWWDTDTGRLYVYYEDGTSSQWVDASPSIPGPAGINGTNGTNGTNGVDGVGVYSNTANVEFGSIGVGTPQSGVLGEIRAAGTITAFYSSDERIKTNLQLIDDPLNKLHQIKGVTFNWTDEEVERRGGIDGKFVRSEEVGVIAQDVEKVLPQIVAERPDGYKAVRYEMIVPLLIESIKEQQKQIDELKRIVEGLNAN